MKAVFGIDGAMAIREVPRPAPGPGQLLLRRVHAAGLNYADRMVLRGTHVMGAGVAKPVATAPAGPVPAGAEAAGEVAEVGPDVHGFAPGDRVMAMCRGAFADYVIADASRAWAVPPSLSLVEAAGVPIAFATAHDALVTAGGLRDGGAVLVNAASSGVGVAALQLAKALRAGTVIASSTSPAKLARLAELGIAFDLGVVAGSPELRERCLQATGGRGVDVIVDNVGASALADNLAVAAVRARIVNVGRLGGQEGTIDLDELARKRVSLVGVTFRTRDAAETDAVLAAAGVDVLPALADGRVRVVIDRTFELSDVVAAYAYFATGQHLGKVVLTTH